MTTPRSSSRRLPPPPTDDPQQVAALTEAANAIDKVRSLQTMAIQFIPNRDYTTFAAEVAVTEGDIVYHFYVTDEVNKLSSPHAYWHERFPQALEKVAQEYFKAKFPRLKAAYTEEQASWWLRAFGFGRVLHPHRLARGLFDALDKELDSAFAAGSAAAGGRK
jgi:hypothetical protein